MEENNTNLDLVQILTMYESEYKKVPKNRDKIEKLNITKENTLISIDSKYKESLKCIPNDLLGHEDFIPLTNVVYTKIKKATESHSRGYAEYNKDFRHIVSDAIFVTVKNEKIHYGFLKRLHNENDTKDLEGTYGLIGGHVNTNESIYDCLIREIEEEIENFDKSNIVEMEAIGLINLDSPAVSKLHLGAIYVIYYSETDSIYSKEENQELKWLTEEEIREKVALDSSVFDSWALITLKKLTVID